MLKSRANSLRGGLIWSLSSRFGSQLMQLAFSIVLARILRPAEFGTIGMLLIFSGFAQLIADSGLSSALIHKQDLQEVDKSTVFWIQLFFGILLTGIFYTSAGALAGFFHDSQLKDLSRAMSSVFVIQALGQVHGTLLRKEFRFQYLAITSIITSVSSGIVAVTLAMAGFGVWALLWQIVIAAGISTSLMWRGLEWTPKWHFSKKSAVALGAYGVYLLGHSGLNYWLRNGDNLIIGRVLGNVDLGIYSRAYNLMLLPINNFGAVFGQVMFPALAKTQHDKEAFRTLYFKSLRLIAFASFPVMSGLALLSREAVLILYGDPWIGMVPILQILSLVGLFQSIIFPVGWIYTALGRTKDQFLLSIFLIAVFGFAMWLGIKGGLIGVTLAYAAWTVISGVMNIYVSSRILETAFHRIFVTVAKVTFATIAMSTAVFVVKQTAVAQTSVATSVLVSMLVGCIVYMAVCWFIREQTVTSLLLRVFGSASWAASRL